MKKLLAILIILLPLLSSGNVAQSQVYIAGELQGVLPDTTYIVVSHIEVIEGSSLLIQPGATFLFNTGCGFNIAGYLHAAGTEEDSIKFMLNTGATTWLGIDFVNATSDSSLLEYCLITGSSDSGVRMYGCAALISHCTITGNTAGYEGGGIRCYNADGAVISYCVISDNEVPSEGGGIQNYSCDTYIDNCIITGNTSGWAGGGINYLDSDSGSVTNCIITGNFADDYGGGINSFAFGYGGQFISKCTISGNTTNQNGGGIYGGYHILANCVIWDNTPYQIQSGMQATYCDIQGGWHGIGNIDEDPLFVMPQQNDFRLQWGSSCIDSGDPDPQYNDPDSTRADMGACYYDQSIPVRILLTPHDAPIIIPPEGGNFEFTIQATNIDSISHVVDIWCDVTLPDGQIFGPVLGPLSVPVGSEETISRILGQAVPGGARAGLYFYNAYAVVNPDTSIDSFMFYKQGSDGGEATGGWSNWGASFTMEEVVESTASELLPSPSLFFTSHPNPFNPVTTLSFKLSKALHVHVGIYDLSGRKVATLLNDLRGSGIHEVTLDGSMLSSGIYIASLKAGNFSQSEKIILLK